MLLNVTRMKPLVSSNALIQTVHNDGTSTYKDIPHGLHYTGHVVSDPDSLVALRENKGLVSWPTQIKLPLWVCFNTFVVQCIIHGEVPHYRKLKGHEIKVALIFLTLISVPLMKWGVNFCDLNFHYFGHKFSIHFVRGVFCQGGDSPVTVKLLWSGQTSLDPLRTFRERTTNKVSIWDYTSFNFVPVVSTCTGFVSCHVNVLHIELFPSLDCLSFALNFLYSKVVFYF